MFQSRVLEASVREKHVRLWVSLFNQSMSQYHCGSVFFFFLFLSFLPGVQKPLLEVWGGYLNASLHSTDLCENLYDAVTFNIWEFAKVFLHIPCECYKSVAYVRLNSLWFGLPILGMISKGTSFIKRFWKTSAVANSELFFSPNTKNEDQIVNSVQLYLCNSLKKYERSFPTLNVRN